MAHMSALVFLGMPESMEYASVGLHDVYALQDNNITVLLLIQRMIQFNVRN